MKKIDIGETIQIVANIGVLAGIVFLAVELQQNSQAIRAQSRAQLSSESAEHLLRMAENSELSEIRLRAFDGAELSDLDAARLRSWMQSQLRRWENIHWQYSAGLYSEDEFVGNTEAWRQAIANPAFRAHWELRRTQFSPEFREVLDGLLIDD